MDMDMDMDDVLEKSWFFQRIAQRAADKASKKEKKQDILRFVEIRFPTLLEQTKQAVEQKTSVEQFQMILDKLYQANSTEEAQAALTPE